MFQQTAICKHCSPPVLIPNEFDLTSYTVRKVLYEIEPISRTPQQFP